MAVATCDSYGKGNKGRVLRFQFLRKLFSELCYFFWIWNHSPPTHHNLSFLSRNACQILQPHWIRERGEGKNESGILWKYIQLVKPAGSRIVYQLLLHSLLNLDSFCN